MGVLKLMFLSALASSLGIYIDNDRLVNDFDEEELLIELHDSLRRLLTLAEEAVDDSIERTLCLVAS